MFQINKKIGDKLSEEGEDAIIKRKDTAVSDFAGGVYSKGLNLKGWNLFSAEKILNSRLLISASCNRVKLARIFDKIRRGLLRNAKHRNRGTVNRISDDKTRASSTIYRRDLCRSKRQFALEPSRWRQALVKSRLATARRFERYAEYPSRKT